MPELPEVEITLRGIEPYILHQKISNVIVRNHKLRWPVQNDINQQVNGKNICKTQRIGKYLVLKVETGSIIIHLGMSGSLRVLKNNTPIKKHDHIDIEFANNIILRLNDPRRFGAFLWTTEEPEQHKLLKNLGIEPLSNKFSAKNLAQLTKKSKSPIKTFLMNSKNIAGVGNIYANEALFDSKINPNQPTNSIPENRLNSLLKSIKKVLRQSIKQGGTTLKDFVNSDGKKGYFQVYLKIYGKKNKPCVYCKTPIEENRMGQRSTFYCPNCQKLF
ncbi:bifunctional DNA-formamidopyrimidine glycosylase/DNA-(apurinic or apyrimidinic site) lyase [Gammaproteobacteria bacterium]|nr:bifunctional DNA-formamidopyrimidine glycosylase/DNA-(apurinic or apyrimidinic site) lyase [Gammaproteobacteria bacterium]